MVNKLLDLDKSLNGPPSVETDTYDQLGIKRIPFRSRLSFMPLIRRIEERTEQRGATEGLLTREILERLKNTPELREPIEDLRLLEKHKDVVEMLLSFILSPIMRETELAKLSVPFNLNAFYYTPALKELTSSHKVNYIINSSKEVIYCATVVGACSLILNKFYGQEIRVATPFSMTVETPEKKLQRHFKTRLDIQFVDIKKLKPLKPLSQEQINHLLSNIYDIELWLKYIPPVNFEFSGFVIGHLIEITEEEALSQLKYRLLRKDAIVDSSNVRDLECLLRTYFNLPSLRLGVTAIDYPIENAAAHKYKIRFDFLANKHEILLTENNRNSIYEKACKYKEVLLIEDLESMSNKTPVERDLIEEGIRSIIVAPLFNKEDQVIGLLEIGSPRPFELHSFVELKFKEVISLFSLAVERSREEIDNQIEAIIREQFTAVHPTVEWKFIEASYNLLNERENDNEQAFIEPIVFNDVYPLYAQADIVSSSDKRNSAIQADLVDNLTRVQKIIKKCLEEIRFPLLNQFLMKVERGIDEVKREFNSSDESRIVDLLHQEIHPILEHLRSNKPELAGTIAGYFSYLDKDLQIVYRERKAYEESVAIINNAISNFLEQQQKETQKVIPHYFEKYKTDGVEYDIYAGKSLLKQGDFCMMHLKNLRLWQLIHMCEITRKVHELQEEMPVKLTTAQLIFAYTNALSIRFRMDEKQFDVDGAYNVRYEILKKRIDKATIEGTNERLTLPGRIAIVYLQEKDRQEYLEYIDYLQHEGFVTDQVEDLRLSRLQGVQGLRALRVTVRLEE